MARPYAATEDGWALAKRGKKAIAFKVAETGDNVPVGTQRDLGCSYVPVKASVVAFKAWVARFRAASRGENPLLTAILDDNLARLEREGHTWRTTQTRYRRLAAFFGSVGVKDVSHALCQAYAKAAQEMLSPWTIWGDLNALRSALRSAWQSKVIDAPCHEYVWNIAKPSGRERTITPEEFWRWYDAATSQHIRLFLVIALLTSARHEAICQLRWEHVDFEKGLIDFAASMRERKSVLDKGWQKNRAVVAITDTLRSYLVAAREVAQTAYVIEYQGKAVEHCREGCARARKAAGLSDDVSPHVLRHTAATWAEAAGIDIERVAMMTGHADKRVLEQIYVHRSGEGSRSAVEAVEKQLGPRLRVIK